MTECCRELAIIGLCWDNCPVSVPWESGYSVMRFSVNESVSRRHFDRPLSALISP